MAQEASIFSLRAQAKKYVLDKWHQLKMELADSSLVSVKRLNQAAERMEKGAKDPAEVIAGRHLRRQYRYACA